MAQVDLAAFLGEMRWPGNRLVALWVDDPVVAGGSGEMAEVRRIYGSGTRLPAM